MPELEHLVEFYFKLGFKQTEILESLAHIHGMLISRRTLKRVLSKAGLFRRKHYSDILDIALHLVQQIEMSGQLHGYKLMHLKCIQDGLIVNQNTVRLLLQILDPDGVSLRKRNRLRRRMYANPGPDFLWHIDGYDKIKPYGICINGCIDGFSRHMIWLEAYKTNSNPAIIGSYFMQAVQSKMGCPKRLRVDFGTENGHMAEMHRFLRYDHGDEFSRKSVVYGSSNHNQRIESWWAFLRKENAQFWMNLFQALKNNDQFTGDFLDKSLIQFCFMQLIQDDLDKLTSLWNTHRIRPSRNQVSPNGRPVIMYNFPHLYDAENHLCRVTDVQINICMEECTPKGPYPCDETIYELCSLLMEEAMLDKPGDPEEATELYNFLRNRIIDDL